MNDSADRYRRFLLMLTDIHHPAPNVEEFRLACRTLQNVLPKQQKQFAKSIGVSGFLVWRARNIALIACRAFDSVESRGLALTKESLGIIRDEGKVATSGATPRKNSVPDASMGATLVLYAVEPWSNRGCCRISDNRKLELPWRLRLRRAIPIWDEVRARLRWIMSRLRSGAT
jgi:hypothetical protein